MTVCRVRAASLGLVALALLIAGGSGLQAAQGAAKVDITGAWIFTVETDGGTGTPTVTLKMDGERITGHYSSATLGEADLTGMLKGAALEFRFSAADIGEVIYKATVESSNAMKGTIDIAGGAATGTFTGKRKQ